MHEFRLSRFGYRLLVSVVIAGVMSLGVMVVFTPYIKEIILAETQGHPWEAELKEANRKTVMLSEELTRMKQVAQNIRKLAGVTDFEATAPPSVTQYAAFPNDELAADESAESIALAESRLPFLLRDRWTPVDEKDLSKRQETLFRSTPSVWPVRGWVTNEFQNRNDPLRRRHLGLDIAARDGAPVQSAGDGVVIFADWDQDLGWLVVVEHGYGFTTRYGHNSSLRVERGNRIRRGEIIALVGSTGRSSAPHLHYEVWMNGTPVDPRSYLPDMLRWDDLLGFAGYVG